ncbi:MAG: menaquinone biosynthesis protein [Bryobacteraceae bacterium]
MSYLNTQPLVWGMQHGEQRNVFDLSFGLPSECADRLGNGTADIGIVPCAELPKLGLEIIRGTGIACRGPVRSILLISRVAPDRIRTLATDSSSRTSVMLARILLAKRFGVEPALLSMPPDLPSMLEAADAALIIGDPALHLDPATIPFHVLDLGTEWMGLTGLPMVFAVWAGRQPVVRPEMAAIFQESCRFGLQNLAEIARREGPPRGIPEALALEYFEKNIVFELGEAEYQGLDLFLQYAAELDSQAVLRKVEA